MTLPLPLLMSDDFEAHLRAFVKESNRIEGITRAPTAAEMREHREFLALKRINIDNLERFVGVIAPGKPLRDQPGMNVRVGNHLPPSGGPGITTTLMMILDNVARGVGAYTTHLRYETLHPFMDGNGRSGRVLWLWQMIHQHCDPWAIRRGFLRSFYYQTLDADRAQKAAA